MIFYNNGKTVILIKVRMATPGKSHKFLRKFRKFHSKDEIKLPLCLLERKDLTSSLKPVDIPKDDLHDSKIFERKYSNPSPKTVDMTNSESNEIQISEKNQSITRPNTADATKPISQHRKLTEGRIVFPFSKVLGLKRSKSHAGHLSINSADEQGMACENNNEGNEGASKSFSFKFLALRRRRHSHENSSEPIPPNQKGFDKRRALFRSSIDIANDLKNILPSRMKKKRRASTHFEEDSEGKTELTRSRSSPMDNCCDSFSLTGGNEVEIKELKRIDCLGKALEKSFLMIDRIGECLQYFFVVVAFSSVT